VSSSTVVSFQLCFRSLFDSGRGYAFPCDRTGQVDLDRLSDAARNNYLYARAMVGRELSLPAVEPLCDARALRGAKSSVISSPGLQSPGTRPRSQ
jgi:hypothetical protein